MGDREKTSLSFSTSLAKEVKKKGIDLDLDFSSAVEAACRSWLSQGNEAQTAEHTETTIDTSPQAYRKQNLPWHDRLEMVLNDKNEALGIQKNLEWAERTVRDKQKRPAGKRASGM